MTSLPELRAASLRRRLASMTYEAVVLFGVVFVAGYLYGALTQQRHALQGQAGLQAFVFVVLAVYFTWFWSRAGQTVAMKAWGIQVVDCQGRRITQFRALLRFLASWLWFAPAGLTIWVTGMKGTGWAVAAVAVGMLAYVGLALMHPQRQYLHDWLCGTRIVIAKPAPGAQPVAP